MHINYKTNEHKLETIYSENELRSFLMKENERYDKTADFFNTYVQKDFFMLKYNVPIDIDNIHFGDLIELVCAKGAEISKYGWGVKEVLIL